MKERGLEGEGGRTYRQQIRTLPIIHRRHRTIELIRHRINISIIQITIIHRIQLPSIRRLIRHILETLAGGRRETKLIAILFSDELLGDDVVGVSVCFDAALERGFGFGAEDGCRCCAGERNVRRSLRGWKGDLRFVDGGAGDCCCGRLGVVNDVNST